MSNPETGSEEYGGEAQHGEPLDTRGVYLMADTPMMAHPLALEDGSGDKQLLAEVLGDELSREELETLINRLVRESNEKAVQKEAEA